MQKSDNAPIIYRITPEDPYAHLYKVQLTISSPNPDGQQLALPSWIAGSYMIRDFAKNIVEIKACCNGQNLNLTQLDKQRWQLPPCADAIDVEYTVYAWDMSVRSAHLDQNHAYFNGTSVFLEVVGQSDKPCSVEINNASIEEAKNWKVGTSLPRQGAEPYGFGFYQAENYEDLIDHPVEIADFDLVTFEACGVPHDFIVTGLHNADMGRLANDLKKVCEYQINLFGEPAPFDRYVFITWAVGNGYGGLEHRASTSLICNREDLPSKKEQGKVSDGYKTFLGLCSHEYFHSWNVKRIQPDIAYELSQENYTPLLWAFEGITSYYDDLVLQRTQLISNQEYLEIVGQHITRLLRTPGRFKQTVTQSSFNAWNKFYKQDENATNAIVSYYNKGAVVALALDIHLRTLSDGNVSLDQVMVALWQQHGKTGKKVQEFDIQNLCDGLLESNGSSNEQRQTLKAFFQQALYETEDLDFEALFKKVGLEFHLRAALSATDKGGNDKTTNELDVEMGVTTAQSAAGAKMSKVRNGSAAHRAGISAGDIIVAINHIKADNKNFDSLLQRYQPGDQLTLHGFRRDELMQFTVTLDKKPLDTVYLTVTDETKLKSWI